MDIWHNIAKILKLNLLQVDVNFQAAYFFLHNLRQLYDKFLVINNIDASTVLVKLMNFK